MPKSHQKISADPARDTSLQTQSPSVHSTEAALQFADINRVQRRNSTTGVRPAASGAGPDMEGTRKRTGLPASHQSVREPLSPLSSSSSLPTFTFISPSLHLLQHKQQQQLALLSIHYMPDTRYPLPCSPPSLHDRPWEHLTQSPTFAVRASTSRY